MNKAVVIIGVVVILTILKFPQIISGMPKLAVSILISLLSGMGR